MTKARSLSDFIESDGSVTLVDNQKIKLGTSNDFEIYHVANSSTYLDASTGNVFIRNSSDDKDIILQTDDGSGGLANYIQADGSNGEVRLYHYGTEKLNTTSTGVDVTGGISIGGTEVINSSRNLTNITNLVVDNIDLGGNALTVASGNFTIDSAGYIEIDADTDGNIYLNDNTVGYGQLSGANGDFTISSAASDKDIIFKGNDGGSTITALTLDMSEAGEATFNSNLCTTTGYVKAGTRSETGGSLVLRSTYSGDNYLSTQGTNHSSGGWYWGYGLQQDGSGTTTSTFSNFSGERSFVQLFGNRMQFNFAGASNTAIGSAVTASEKVRISNEGICFNGDSAAANALDDYEEGTFTATLKGGSTGSVTQTEATYTKIGNTVHCHVAFLNANTTGYSGHLRVEGLPFAASSSNLRAPCTAAIYQMATFSGAYVIGLVESSSHVNFYSPASNANWTAVTHNAGTGRYLEFHVTYQTNS